MSQPVHEAINMPEIPSVETRTGTNPGPYDTMVAPLDSMIPRPGHPPHSGPNHPPQGESGFADGSGPLFSMYLQLAGEEDKKMAENWKGDADGILIFVSRHSTSDTSTHTNPEVQDRFILCRRRNI